MMGSPMPGVGSSFFFVRISYPLFPGLTKKICLLVPLRLLSPLADRYWGYFSQCCFQHQMGSGTGLGCATPRVQENPVTWGARSAPEDPVGNVEMRFFSTQSLLSPVCISHLEIQASLKKKKKDIFFCGLSTSPAFEAEWRHHPAPDSTARAGVSYPSLSSLIPRIESTGRNKPNQV